MSFFGHIVRFIVAAIVLMITSWMVPNFKVPGFWNALMLAIVIALLGWLVERIFESRVTPFGRGIVGFIISALVIYVAGFFVEGVYVGFFGAILAALVIGLIDLFIPMTTPFETRNRTRHEAR